MTDEEFATILVQFKMVPKIFLLFYDDVTFTEITYGI